jgi:hypothetical protein
VQRIRKWGDSKLRNDLAPSDKEHRLATNSREFESPWEEGYVICLYGAYYHDNNGNKCL